MNKPNLFNFATKELSQDAFIAWLMVYADKSNEKFNSELHQCAQEFVTKLITSQYPDFNDEIKSVKVGRQWENIDVWAEVNDDYFILIEDKTNTGEHSNQLEKYRNQAVDFYNKQDTQRNIVCIYLKTGDDTKSNRSYVEGKGYKAFGRKELLNIFKKHSEIKNEIFSDFVERLDFLEEENKKFETKNVEEWEYSQWVGFYQYLENSLLENLDWGYVPNPNGGFLGCWFSFLDSKDNTEIYLQIESDKKVLVFRVSTDATDSKEQSRIRQELQSAILEQAQKLGFNEIQYAKYPRAGQTMRFAMVEGKDWLGEGVLDLQKVRGNLLKYQAFLTEFAQSYK